MNASMKKHPKRPFPHSVMGLTLIEVLIALVIGLLLIAGAFSLFINNKRVFNENQQMGRLQESARIAIELLTNDIRRAGFIGCHHEITQVTNLIKNSNGLFDISINNGNTNLAIEGLVSGTGTTVWQPSGVNWRVTGTGIGQPVAGTDAITVRYLSGEYWDVLSDMTATNSPLVVSTENNFKKGEFVAVSDCTSTHLFQNGGADTDGEIKVVTDATVTPGNDPQDLGRVYTENARVRRYIAVRYYIGNSRNQNTADNGSYNGPSLFREAAIGNPSVGNSTVAIQELIEGIENMQILYGVDDADADDFHDGVPDRYLPANHNDLTGDNVANWMNVVSVKIALLLRSIDENHAEDPDERTYDLLDANSESTPPSAIDPEDLSVRRRVFTTTIQIKNRI